MSPEAGSLSPSRRTGRRARGRRGSGLIETLIALEVMTLAMIGILQLFSLSILVNGVAAAKVVGAENLLEPSRYTPPTADAYSASPPDPPRAWPKTLSAPPAPRWSRQKDRRCGYRLPSPPPCRAFPMYS